MRILLVGLVIAVSAPAVGQTVQNDGSLSYSYSVPLPHARGHYQPTFTLMYSNRSQGDGTLGVGWVMDHCYIEQGTRASLDTGGNARQQLWLVRGYSRALLVPVAGTTGTFRPDIDTGYTVVNSSGSDYSMVDNHGTAYSFHQYAGDTGKNTPNRWYLVSVQDVDGNKAQFTYTSQDGTTTAPQAPLANGALLSRIDYDNYGTNQWAHSVIVTPGSALWSMTQSASGALVKQAQLVSNIAVTGIGGGYQYRFSYEYETTLAGRARLTNIVRRDLNGDYQPDNGTSFVYTPVGPLNRPQSASATLTVSDPSNLLGSCGAECAFTTGSWIDMDGDGRPDLVWQNSAGIAWARNISWQFNPQLAPASQISGSLAAGTSGGRTLGSTVGPPARNGILRDFNGDGVPDLVYDDSSCPHSTGSLEFAVAFGQVDRAAHQVSFLPRICLDVTNVYHDWALTKQAASGFFCVTCGDSVVLHDMDGDGVVDLFLQTTQGSWYLHRGYSTGTTWTFSPTSTAVFWGPDGGDRSFVDVNGDGRPDVLGASGASIWLGAGGGLQANYAFPSYPVPPGTLGWFLPSAPLAFHPFPDLGDSSGATGHRNYGMGILYGSAAAYDEPYSAIPAFTSAAGISYSAVPVGVDIDGDGFPDAISNYNQTSGTRYIGFFTGSASAPYSSYPESWLSSIATSDGATIQISYAPFTKTQTTAREPSWVVGAQTITGPGIAKHRTRYSYANMQTATPSWDDLQRLESFGFADTYTQDETSLQVVHTSWGNNHLTAGKAIATSIGTATTLFGGIPDNTVQYYSTTRHRYQARPVGARACLTSPPIQRSTTQSLNGYPVIAVDTAMQLQNEVGSMWTVIGSFNPATPDCSYVDDAGNVSYVAKATETTLITRRQFPNISDSTVSCKSCATQIWATDINGNELGRRYYYYDAPTGSAKNSITGITKGHLNYVAESVDSGHTEVAKYTAYNADGTIQFVERDYPSIYSDVSSVIESYSYDATGLLVTQVTRTDLNQANPAAAVSTPLIVSRVYDSAGLGLLVQESGPYQQGQAADPSTLYIYDIFNRIKQVGRSENGSTYPIAGYDYLGASTTAERCTFTYSFASKFAWPFSTSFPAQDDVRLSITYFDALGRPTQTRSRLGTGTPAQPGANITQALTGAKYLVTGGVNYDGAGRVAQRLDPYYSTTSAYADYTVSPSSMPASELNTPNLHVTGFTYDNRGRLICEAYTASTNWSSTLPCVSSGAVKAKGYSYALIGSGSSIYVAVTKTLEFHTASSKHPLDAFSVSGRALWSQDSAGNFTSIPQYDALGRVTGVLRQPLDGSKTLGYATLYDERSRVVQQYECAASGTGSCSKTYLRKDFRYLPTGEVGEIDFNYDQWSTVQQSRIFRYGSLGRPADVTDQVVSLQGSTWVTTASQEHKPHYDASQYGLSYTADRISWVDQWTLGNWSQSPNFAYSSLGQIAQLQMEAADGTLVGSWSVSRTYRPDGQPLTWSATAPGMNFNGQTSSPHNSRTVAYSYDSAGRLVQAAEAGDDSGYVLWSVPNGDPATGAFDALNRAALISKDAGNISLAMTYSSALNDISSSSVQLGSSAAFYNPGSFAFVGSKLQQVTDSATATTFSYQYDDDGRATSAVASSTGSMPAQSFSETYGFQVAPPYTGSTWDLGAVTSNRMPSNISESYASDGSGNITSHTAGSLVQTLAYDGANRLFAIARGAPGAPVTQEQIYYDYFGNIAQRIFPVGSDSNNAGEDRRYYLGEEITVIKHTNGTFDSVFHVPVRGGRPADIWGTASPVPNCGQVAPKTCQDGVTYFHRDRLGSVIAASMRGAAAPAVQWRYLPYGLVDFTVGTETIDARSERGYADALRISESLLFMRARVYDPRSRRFLQADNVDLLRYTYAGGDPINRVDVSGHSTENSPPGICGPGDNCSVYYFNPEGMDIIYAGLQSGALNLSDPISAVFPQGGSYAYDPAFAEQQAIEDMGETDVEVAERLRAGTGEQFHLATNQDGDAIALADLLVIENGPTADNPIGHTAIAITGFGLFSSGNGYAAGSSVSDYVLDQADRRDTTFYLLHMTPQQDAALAAVADSVTDPRGIGLIFDNCAVRASMILDAAGVPSLRGPLDEMPFNYSWLPGMPGIRASMAGATQYFVPMGSTSVPAPFYNFDPYSGF